MVRAVKAAATIASGLLRKPKPTIKGKGIKVQWKHSKEQTLQLNDKS